MGNLGEGQVGGQTGPGKVGQPGKPQSRFKLSPPPNPRLSWSFIQAIWICISYFGGADPSNPIWVSAKQHRVRGNKTPIAQHRVRGNKVSSSHFIPCAGYCASLLAAYSKAEQDRKCPLLNMNHFKLSGKALYLIVQSLLQEMQLLYIERELHLKSEICQATGKPIMVLTFS